MRRSSRAVPKIPVEYQEAASSDDSDNEEAARAPRDAGAAYGIADIHTARDLVLRAFTRAEGISPEKLTEQAAEMPGTLGVAMRNVLPLLAIVRSARLAEQRVARQQARERERTLMIGQLAALLRPQQGLTLVYKSHRFKDNVGIFIDGRMTLHLSRYVADEDPPIVLFNRFCRWDWLSSHASRFFRDSSDRPLAPLARITGMTPAELARAPNPFGNMSKPASLLTLAALTLAKHWADFDADAHVAIIQTISQGHPLFTRTHPIVTTAVTRAAQREATLKRPLEDAEPSARDEKRPRGAE